MNPFVAIPCRRVSEGTVGIPTIGVRESYIKALQAVNLLPLLVPLGLEQESVDALLKHVGGVLLTGGEDVAPNLYGEDKHPKLGAVCEERDALEIYVARWAITEQVPLLGICRGIQVLNVAAGGTLYQDIPSQCDSDIVHTADRPADHMSHCSHLINLEPGTRFYELFGGCESVAVNSMHHQAIKDLGKGLIVAGRSLDGIIEAVEGAREGGFIIGVQCHPELLWDRSDSTWKKLFEGFSLAVTHRKLDGACQ